MKKKTWIALLVVLLLIPGIMVYAADDPNLLASSVGEVKANDAYTFCVDLSGIPETYTNYTLSLAVSPEVTYLSTQENVSFTYNAVQKTYQIASADLAGISSLNVSAFLPEDALSGATYTVTAVALSESGESVTDTLTFTVAASSEEENGSEAKTGTGTEETAGDTAGASGVTGGSGSTVASSASVSSSGSAATATYQGSYHNYLASLAVSGYDFQSEFIKTNDTYFITVANDVTAVTVDAAADDEDAVVAVTGNDDLSVGVNKILVSVTAENGNVRTYRIYVTREDAA